MHIHVQRVLQHVQSDACDIEHSERHSSKLGRVADMVFADTQVLCCIGDVVLGWELRVSIRRSKSIATSRNNSSRVPLGWTVDTSHRRDDRRRCSSRPLGYQDGDWANYSEYIKQECRMNISRTYGAVYLSRRNLPQLACRGVVSTGVIETVSLSNDGASGCRGETRTWTYLTYGLLSRWASVTDIQQDM